jgi:hypothetical protein
MPKWLTNDGYVEMTWDEWNAHAAKVCLRVSNNAVKMIVKNFLEAYPPKEKSDG